MQMMKNMTKVIKFVYIMILFLPPILVGAGEGIRKFFFTLFKKIKVTQYTIFHSLLLIFFFFLDLHYSISSMWIWHGMYVDEMCSR